MTTRSLDPKSLVREWQGPIYNLALRRLGHEADAADVTQEVFLKAFLNLHQLRSAELLKAWIYRIANNAISDAIRRIRRRREVEAVAPAREAEPGGQAVDKAELRAALQSRIRELPDRVAQAITLHYYQGLSQREIGAILQVPRSTVQSQLQKGLSLLKSGLAPSGALVLVPDIEAALLSTAFEAVPAELSRRLGSLANQGIGATAAPKGTTMIKAKIATLTAVVSAGAFFAGLAVNQKAPERDTRQASAAETMALEQARQAEDAASPRRASAARDERAPSAEATVLAVARAELARERQRAAKAEAAFAKLEAARAAEAQASVAAFRARLDARGAEAAAIGALRTMTTAQSIFRESDRDRNGVNNYADLEALGRANLVDLTLALGLKQGYVFHAQPCEDSPNLQWWASASPMPGIEGRHFYTNQSGIIFFDNARPLTPRADNDTAPAFGIAIGAYSQPRAAQVAQAIETEGEGEKGQPKKVKAPHNGFNEFRLLGEPEALLALCEDVLLNPKDPDRTMLLLTMGTRRGPWKVLPMEVRARLNKLVLRLIESEQDPQILAVALEGLEPIATLDDARRALPRFAELAAGGPLTTRLAALNALEGLPLQERFEPIVAVARDRAEDPRLRDKAAEALSDMDPRELSLVVDGLRGDPSASMRIRYYQLLHNLIRQGVRSYNDSLVDEYVAERSEEVAEALLGIITYSGKAQGIDALEARIKSKALVGERAQSAARTIKFVRARMR